MTGPLLQAQLIETPLLNMINFSTLIATKSARICLVARGAGPGVRAASGPGNRRRGDGAAGRRSSGAASATSNLLAGKLFGIPVRGHARTQLGDGLRRRDRSVQGVRPGDAQQLRIPRRHLRHAQGVRHAAEVGKWLASQGHQLVGVRLDSGDLAYLSIEARKILDQAGLTARQSWRPTIWTSASSRACTSRARIGVWGVGTKLVTAYDSPALGGVYKLSALRSEQGNWDYKIKLSEQTAKTSIPGILQVRRFRDSEGLFSADAMYDVGMGIQPGCGIVDPTDFARNKQISPDAAWEDLLVPVLRDGQQVYSPPDLPAVQKRCREQCAALHPAITRLLNPHRYPAGLESHLHEMRLKMIDQAKTRKPRS